MLKVDDLRGLVVDRLDIKRNISIETAYVEFDVTSKESAQRPGKMETWYNFKSRPAAELAFIEVDTSGIPRNLRVWLMKKQHTIDRPPLYKIPGGYIITEDPDFSLAKKIEADTGLRLIGKCWYLGSAASHPEIVTPLGLYATFNSPDANLINWEQVGDPRPGIELESFGWKEALSLFAGHRLLASDNPARNAFAGAQDLLAAQPPQVRDNPEYLINSTGFELLFRLERMLSTLRLVISGYTHH